MVPQNGKPAIHGLPRRANKLGDFRRSRVFQQQPSGTYLFQADCSVNVIDFGCVKVMSARFAETLPRVLAAYCNDDPDSLFQAYGELGKLSGLERLADEFIFFDRTIYGLCKLFERLGARVRTRHHWLALAGHDFTQPAV